jgi:teichuronic acid exporter
MLIPDRADVQPPRSLLALRGVFWSAINIIVPTLGSLSVFVVTSRMLTPADFGIVAVAGTLAAAASALVPVGFGDAIVQRMDKNPAFLDSVFWLCVLAGTVLYAILVLLAGDAARFYGAPLLTVIVPVLGLRVIADAAAVVPLALVTKALSFHLIALRTVITTLVSATVSIGLILLGSGLWALVASILANSVVATVAMFWSTGWMPRLRFSVRDIVALAGYGAFASGTRIVTFIGTQADQAVVGFVLGTTQLGLYNFARRTFSLLKDETSGAMSTVAHPLFAGIQNDRSRVRRGFLSATFLSSVIAFPVFVGLACVADRAIPLVCGPQWTGALHPIQILCALGMLSCIGSLQAGLITSLGRANWWFYYQVVVSLLNIPIIALFAHDGTSVLLIIIVAKAYLFWPVTVAMTLRLLAMRPGAYLAQFVAPLVSAIAMGGVIFAGRRLLPEMPVPAALATDIALGAAAYAIVLTASARQRVKDLVLMLHGMSFGRRRLAAAVDTGAFG